MAEEEKEEISSGFIGTDIIINDTSLTDIAEYHVSKQGYNSLYRCQRYGKLHLLKALQPTYRGQSLYETALRKEFVIGYQLDHPNICHTLGWENVKDLGNCILLEYVDGMTLKELMEQDMLDRDLAYKIIKELCSALQYIHSKQIVHRDLKPANILITHNGNNVKLIDFGLSDCDDYDILKVPAGTRYYLAPEVLEEGHPLDLRADIYSLGVVLGEMAERIGDKKLADISRKCTQNKPEKRYPSAAHVAQAAASVFNQTARKRMNKAAVFISAVVLFLVAGSVLYILFEASDKQVAVEPSSISAQNNFCMGDRCRRLLSAKRIALHQGSLMTEKARKADSLELVKQLIELLNADYPLPQQRQSIAYHKQCERIFSELQDIYH